MIIISNEAKNAIIIIISNDKYAQILDIFEVIFHLELRGFNHYVGPSVGRSVGPSEITLLF